MIEAIKKLWGWCRSISKSQRKEPVSIESLQVYIGMTFPTTRGTTFEVHKVVRHARGFQFRGLERTKRDILEPVIEYRRLGYGEFRRLCGVDG